ncbi:FAD-dependent oxidoreductase [Pseudomonas sp. NBRC 100443]|uniref:NAD(P)/FAD-dependent oxidoreductase n=1 Tax=Pseudomonas sp. NBRC 100443 TaxID=1113665 RepID=UPI0024A33048|nr:FAD-dependent oxidoreductase [Pseudomonas sp. NBRC 100443]GLU37367.1 oxidoreductase [Pseudomonas sp. NBRC 100443]
MSDATAVVILGAGQAGFQLASSLREGGYDGSIALIGEEPHLPYSRPPLSKAFLSGKVSEGKLALRPESFYRDQRIDLYLGRRAVAVDRTTRTVALDDGESLGYDHLVFATGARNRALPVEGAQGLGGVYGLRTLDDARQLRGALASARRAVVIGAGFVGLEFAATAQQQGVQTTVIELQPRPLARAVSASMAAIFSREHRHSGVDLRFDVSVRRLLGDNGRVCALELSNGEHLSADLVLVGIGAQANSELADACGLDVEGGIVVDAQLRTRDPHVSAIGDCAVHPNAHAAGRAIRLESIQNAADQARCLAARLCGQAADYGSLPWFWSDQGSLKLQIAGLIDDHDQLVVRGDPQGTACSVFCFKDKRLVAVESVNRPADHIQARRLLKDGIGLSPEQAADPQVDLRSLTTLG